MILVWRGNGIIVPLGIVAYALFGVFIDGQKGAHYFESHAGPKLFGAFLIGLALWFLGVKSEDSDRTHDFFWIPIKFWGIVFVIGGIIFAMTSPSGHAAESQTAKQVEAPAAVPAPQPRLEARTATPIRMPDSAPEPPPPPPPAAATAAPEPVKTFAQVYADNATKIYYPETCEHPASAAIRMSKSAAKIQGYTLAAGCTE
jgi:hypothetical protein